MGGPVSLSAATAILITGDPAGWHPLANSLGAAIGPSFVDPAQTDDQGRPVVITPGDNWIQFVDAATGQAYAAPFHSIAAVQLAAGQAAQVMPSLVQGAGVEHTSGNPAGGASRTSRSDHPPRPGGTPNRRHPR